MANTYTPTNVRVEGVLSGSISIDWDMSSVMEKNRQAKYKVWGSNDDGVTWDLISTVIRRSEATITNDYDWISVSSVHPTLGESAKSTPLKLIAASSAADVNLRSAVGIDEDGQFHYLKVSSDGGLILGEGIDISIDTTDLGKEAKQDDMISLLAQIQLDLARIPAFKEGELTSVTPAGSTLTVGWTKSAMIDQVLVIQEAGAATNFEVAVLAKLNPASERDIITKMVSNGSLRLDILGSIPYINRDGLDEMYIRIIPDSGTSNNYFVRVAGHTSATV